MPVSCVCLGFHQRTLFGWLRLLITANCWNRSSTIGLGVVLLYGHCIPDTNHKTKKILVLSSQLWDRIWKWNRSFLSCEKYICSVWKSNYGWHLISRVTVIMFSTYLAFVTFQRLHNMNAFLKCIALLFHSKNYLLTCLDNRRWRKSVDNVLTDSGSNNLWWKWRVTSTSLCQNYRTKLHLHGFSAATNTVKPH